MKKFRPFVLSSSLCVMLTVSGCSMFSSGSGEGEGSLSESEIAANQAQRFGSGNIPTPEGEGIFQDIRFNFDSYAIEGMARTDLENNAKLLSDNPSLKVILEGHCDERGTVEYNMALGAERARAVKAMLTALGIPSSQVSTISYGEEIPLDMGHDEGAYAANRRVHFALDGSEQAPAGNARY
jgi:peptidoglycan-associated lipoprotein